MRMNVEALKKNVIERARRDYVYIYPCVPKQSLEECFTIEKGKIYFWFNTEDRSTRIIMEPLPTQAS